MSDPRPIDILTVLPLPAWADLQSALHPGSDEASRIASIGDVMFVGAAVIFVAVIALLTLAMLGPARIRALLGRRAWIVGGGVVFPVIVLTILLVYGLRATSFLSRADGPPAAQIEVTGEMWWWRVRYLDDEGAPLFETANDIRIPVGAPVQFVLRSDNVIHSFWVPNLAGKLDMVPGHVNRLRLQAREPGVFRGQCAEYCGAQHAKMAFTVQALPPDEFSAWMAAQRQAAAEPADARLLAGRRSFMQACARCHTIRGTAASGTEGPDLTHVGSRLSLAAGTLPNNIGTLAGWIAGNQHIKPGNAMPSFDRLPAEELRAIARYLDHLK